MEIFSERKMVSGENVKGKGRGFNTKEEAHDAAGIWM